MDSHVFRKAAWRLPALADLAVLRFNTRGTSSVRGTSEGAFDDAVGERFDVAAAIEYAEFAELPNIWLVGWSFGTDLALKYGCDPAVAGAILLSPPLRFSAPGGPGRLGRVGQAADRAGARVRRLPAPGRGAGAVRGGAAGRGGRGARRQAPLGRRRRDGAGRDRPPGQPGRRRCRCRRPGTARWRPATSARTPTGRWPPSPTRPVPGPAASGDCPADRRRPTAQRRSWRGSTTSRRISWSAATVGIAISAPTTPSSATPSSAASSAATSLTSTDRRMIFG